MYEALVIIFGTLLRECEQKEKKNENELQIF